MDQTELLSLIVKLFFTVIGAAGIPSAVVGFFVWKQQQKILKRDKEKEEENLQYRAKREEREKDREQLEIHLIESVNAAIALSEATARAVQRIPDAHCNGDMHKALSYAEEVKRRQKTFLTQKGVHSII